MSMQMAATTAITTSVDPMLSLLVGAFGAAVLTVFGGLIGAWIQSVREHRKWLREQRFEAYRAFMNDMSKLTDLVDIEPNRENAERLKAKVEELSEQLGSSGDVVSMLGPRAVNAAGQDWMGAATAFATERTKANRDAVRRGRWQFLMTVGKELNSKNVGDAPPVARPL